MGAFNYRRASWLANANAFLPLIIGGPIGTAIMSTITIYCFLGLKHVLNKFFDYLAVNNYINLFIIITIVQVGLNIVPLETNLTVVIGGVVKGILAIVLGIKLKSLRSIEFKSFWRFSFLLILFGISLIVFSGYVWMTIIIGNIVPKAIYWGIMIPSYIIQIAFFLSLGGVFSHASSPSDNQNPSLVEKSETPDNIV